MHIIIGYLKLCVEAISATFLKYLETEIILDLLVIDEWHRATWNVFEIHLH